jgi:hypothetical protein
MPLDTAYKEQKPQVMQQKLPKPKQIIRRPKMLPARLVKQQSGLALWPGR